MLKHQTEIMAYDKERYLLRANQVSLHFVVFFLDIPLMKYQKI